MLSRPHPLELATRNGADVYCRAARRWLHGHRCFCRRDSSTPLRLSTRVPRDRRVSVMFERAQLPQQGEEPIYRGTGDRMACSSVKPGCSHLKLINNSSGIIRLFPKLLSCAPPLPLFFLFLRFFNFDLKLLLLLRRTLGEALTSSAARCRRETASAFFRLA